MRSNVFRLAWMVVLFWCAAATAAQTPSPPATVVQSLHGALLRAMKGGAHAGYRGRYDILKPVVQRTFDLTFIARLVLGDAWTRLTPEQQQRFVDAFTRLSVANYASHFNSYGGEQFRTLSTSAQKPGIDLVRTELVQPDGHKHTFDYLLHQTRAGWRIVNVVADGVSNLSLQRSEYSGVLAHQGFDALIERLNASAKKMATGR